MKNTKSMVAFIATTVLFWLFLGLIGYAVSDATFKECLSSMPMILIMFIFGWIPGVFVLNDLDN